MTMNEIPDERLRVFISSAQSNEGIFAWSEVRRRIKDYLKEFPYLNPFIIEDVASPVKSEQFYQMQLLRADLVVLLVKGEVRKGTATEYALATKHKKPMLIYFLDDGSQQELSAVALKKDVQAKDYCTYHSASTFDDIEKVVRKHVIESLICSFQFKTMEDKLADTGTEVMTLPNETQPFERSVPTKTAIGLFNSCYGHIFDLLSIPQVKSREPCEPSILHDLGVAALDWLVKGEGDISDGNILAMIDHVSNLYSETDLLTRRWDAIRHELAGDIDGALKAENQALCLARAANMPPWIIANILIDCRNMRSLQESINIMLRATVKKNWKSWIPSSIYRFLTAILEMFTMLLRRKQLNSRWPNLERFLWVPISAESSTMWRTISLPQCCTVLTRI